MQPTHSRIILVVENATNLSIGRNLLKPHYEVYPAPSVNKLFEILENVIPDLVLLDIEMPDMNGFEAIKKMKGDNRFNAIPVICLTSKTDEIIETEGFSLGAVEYVSKPFSGPLLQKRVANQLYIEQQKKGLM